MSLSQVHNMNIISISGAVSRLVVVAIHRDLLSSTNCNLLSQQINNCVDDDDDGGHLSDIRHQVVGNSKRIFPDVPRLMSTRRIEVPYKSDKYLILTTASSPSSFITMIMIQISTTHLSKVTLHFSEDPARSIIIFSTAYFVVP